MPAGPLRLTVPVEDVPPVTEFGLTEIPVKVAAVIVSVAVWLVPLTDPVMIAEVLVATGTVLIVKVAVDAPAATITFAGTVAFVDPEERVTVVPPVGA